MVDPTQYWGKPDSLINWCEHDYVDQVQIAEFWNTWSNLFFIISGLLSIRLALKYGLPASYWIAAVSIVLTGTFSFAFHASLRWWMQKMDESFETVLILGIFHSFDSDPSLMYTHIVTAVVGILFIEKWFCEIHLVIIALLTFWSLYQLGWHLLQSVATSLYYRLFGRIRNYFVIAGLAWLVDRIACQYLYDLPYNLPNPQLHAFGWHLGCALGLNETMIAVLIMHKLNGFKGKNTLKDAIRLKSVLFIPYDIEMRSANSAKSKKETAKDK